MADLQISESIGLSIDYEDVDYDEDTIMREFNWGDPVLEDESKHQNVNRTAR